ncbi:MAG: VCBS repeat-containing protein [Reichenbachiella sp.]
MLQQSKSIICLIILVNLLGCEPTPQVVLPDTLFEKVSPSFSTIDFENKLTETDSINYFNYPYIYMGGGVAVADFNNDDHQDIFFTGNMVSNRLYLGAGDLTFSDVTQTSNTAGDQRWMQGVTICDINADGKTDLYISVSGANKICQNILLVNKGNNQNGIPQFEEEAEKYGIADGGHSTQAAFFDYDKDGDLDLYVINYPITAFDAPNFYYKQMMINAKHKDSSHLYRNNGDGTFEDVTKAAGLLNFGLSLSASVGDINNDGWPDMYVSNDFASPDFIYINNQNGTFTDQSKSITRQTSFYGMGSDIADYNNDGLMDILQVDMAPEDNRRSKENMSGMNPESFSKLIDQGLHHQYMYNSLQLNRGLDAQGLPQFSNVAWFSGMSSTDWSWSPLFVDLDIDGWKDIYITNGTRRDINNNDFFNTLEKDEVYFSSTKRNDIEVENIHKMPSEALSNYVFQNNGNLSFTKKMKAWGLDDKSFSNGAAYADLDNDGDWELIVNNIDEPASIYKNNANNSSNFIKLNITGPKDNPLAVGTRVHVWSKGIEQMNEMALARGFQSSVETNMIFGLGNQSQADSLSIIWPNGKKTNSYKIRANSYLKIAYSDSSSATIEINRKEELNFSETSLSYLPNLIHKENDFDDFSFQVLLPHKMSSFGPALAVGDINGDSLDDAYVGASVGQNGQLLIQLQDGTFKPLDFQSKQELQYEDLDAIWFDADNDEDLDLYIVSGGNEYSINSEQYQDRLYINDRGTLKKSKGVLPTITGSGSCVRPYDFDRDGDMDLFIGGRLSPRNYPMAGQSYLLENKINEGLLKFVDVTKDLSPTLADIGMVTDAMWTDTNSDGNIDLMLVGEWMPITVLESNGEQLIDKSGDYFSGNTRGWWFSIDQGDFDQDGDMDYVLGNLGKNYKYSASPEATFNIYAGDFDHNGQQDIVLSYHNFGEEYPVRGRSCSSQQIPSIKNKFKDYSSYSTASIVDVYGEDQLEASLTYKVENFASVYIENEGETMKITSLPNEAQLSTINDMIVEDFDGDDILDILMVGGLYASEVETPRSDADLGLILKGTGNGEFEALPMSQSGIYIPYNAKKLTGIIFNHKTGFLVANNNGPLQLFISNNE